LFLILHAQGKLREAESVGREAVELKRSINPHGYGTLAVSLRDLALVLKGQGRLADAEASYREAVELYRKVNSPYGAASSLKALGEVLQEQGKLTDTEAAYKEAFAFLRNLADQGQRPPRLGDMYWRGQGVAPDPAEAAKWFGKAAESGDTEDALAFAWLLAIWDDPKFRDGRKAVDLAEKAVMERKNAHFLEILAAAYAEAGQFESAVKVQKEAMRLVGDEVAKKNFAARLKLYESNSPCREHDALDQFRFTW